MNPDTREAGGERRRTGDQEDTELEGNPKL